VIPRILSRIKNSENIEALFLDSGYMICEFDLTPIDVELTNLDQIQSGLNAFLQNLPTGMRVKFRSSSRYEFRDFGQLDVKRSIAVSKIGALEQMFSVCFEKRVKSFTGLLTQFFKKGMKDEFIKNDLLEFIGQIDLNQLESLGLKPEATKSNIIFPYQKIRQSQEGLKINDRFMSVLKLSRLGNFDTHLLDLSFIKAHLPDHNEVVVSIERIDEKETQFLLNNKSKREESGQDLKSSQKYVEAQKALAEIDHEGKKLFRFEFTILLKFFSQDEMTQRSHEIRTRLSPLGDFTLEDKGAFFSYLSTLQGMPSHITNIEVTDRLAPFIPIMIQGASQLNALSKRSFVFHREDLSLDQFDLFDSRYSNYSGIVIGRSGRGKSVFTNTLQQSLLHDPDLKIILVDVKGSHTNTVKNLNGSVYKISSDSQTAISPFNFLRDKPSKEIIEIVSDFLEKLLLEDHESSLLRQEQAKLESALVKYIETKPTNPSLDDFLKRIKDIPRRDSLSRWAKGGIYEGVFSLYNPLELNTRIHYFDFTNIVTAQKGGVGSAIMSAIMAHFNYLLLSKKTEEKLVFIADETPFFIRSCFSSFSLLMKNVRKLNGSLILIAQNLSDLVVQGNSSLIDQTEVRIFFSQDSDAAAFQALSGLSNTALSKLEQMTTVNGKYSQFVVKDPRGERSGRLILSKEEYFRSSTFAEDRRAIEQISSIFKLKDENLAIEILADIETRYEGII